MKTRYPYVEHLSEVDPSTPTTHPTLYYPYCCIKTPGTRIKELLTDILSGSKWILVNGANLFGVE